MADIEEIVVPVDGSENAEHAAAFAARLAAATRARIRLIYVFPATELATVGFARMSAEEVKQAQNNAARDIFDKARVTTDIDELVLFGDPASELIDYIEQHPDSLVVMGRRGLSPIKSLLMGSVSEKVARYARGAVTLAN